MKWVGLNFRTALCGTASLAVLLSGPQGFANRDAVERIPEVAEKKKEEPIIWLNPNSLDAIRVPLGFEVQRTNVVALMNDADRQQKRKVRVAVLDMGFAHWEKRRGVSLPSDTKFIQGPQKGPNDNAHGSLMAEMLTSMVAGPVWQRPPIDMSKLPFELYLVQVSGFTDFRSAIDFVIKEKIDVVLYSEVWEIGGNWDGRGFLNAEVNRALKTGLIWVNAAGNLNGQTYTGPIEVGNDRVVKLPDERHGLKIVCTPERKGDGCPVKITVAWNDFNDDWQKGTKKDLNAGLFNEDFEAVQVARLKQVDVSGFAPDFQSKYPRESFKVKLEKGTYYIGVKSAPNVQWTERDFLRVLVDGIGISMPSGSKTESLQNPADNRGVITVGATDTDRSSVSIALRKPEVVIRSSVTDNLGQEFRGSSNSAALAAGGIVLLKYQSPRMNRRQILEAISGPPVRNESRWSWNDYGIQINTNGSCLPTTNIRTNITAIDNLMASGARWVQTMNGPRLVVDFPLSNLRSDLTDVNPQTAVMIGTQGLVVVSRGQMGNGMGGWGGGSSGYPGGYGPGGNPQMAMGSPMGSAQTAVVYAPYGGGVVAVTPQANPFPVAPPVAVMVAPVGGGQPGMMMGPQGNPQSQQQSQMVEVLQRPRGTVFCDETWAPSLYQLPLQ